MKIGVVGVGYLGAVHATALASIGFDVTATDVDDAKVASLNAGKATFHEPGFDSPPTRPNWPIMMWSSCASVHRKCRAGALPI